MKSLREQRNYTQADLSKLVNTGAANIRNYEQGRTFPSPDIIEAIAKALSVYPSALFRYPEEELPESKRPEPKITPEKALEVLNDHFGLRAVPKK